MLPFCGSVSAVEKTDRYGVKLRVGGFRLRGGKTHAFLQHRAISFGHMLREAGERKGKCGVPGGQVEGPQGRTGRGERSQELKGS